MKALAAYDKAVLSGEVTERRLIAELQDVRLRLVQLISAAEEIMGWPASQIDSEMFRTIPVDTFQAFVGAVQKAKVASV